MNTQETPMTNPQSVDEGKVDVLAVLDKHIKAERALGYEASAREGEEARDAVAELIEAMKNIHKWCQDTSFEYEPLVDHVERQAGNVLAHIGATP